MSLYLNISAFLSRVSIQINELTFSIKISKLSKATMASQVYIDNLIYNLLNMLNVCWCVLVFKLYSKIVIAMQFRLSDRINSLFLLVEYVPDSQSQPDGIMRSKNVEAEQINR